MKSLQNQYNLILEGKGKKDVFLKEAKRLYPNLLTNSSNFNEAEAILKNKGVISENIVAIPAIGSLKDSTKKDWIKVFEENVKADETKPSKEVEDINTHGYDNADKKNLDNQIFDQYLNGLYVELKKDPELTMEKAREIVAKNLASDSLYYMKNAAIKVDGIGYTDEAPGLTPKEITGKYKSSGYGDLKENKLRKAIRSIIREELNEDHTSNSNDKYEVKYSKSNDTWQVWEGDFLVKDFATKEKAQAYANRKNQEQGLNESEDLSKEFAVVERGGNIGSQSNYVPQFKGRIVKTFDTAEEAKEYAKQRRSGLSPGEKSYYKMTYVVVRNLKSNMKKD